MLVNSGSENDCRYLESHFIICFEEFEGADHESAICFCVSFIVSNL